MKRIQAACLCQTLHYLLKENIEQNEAAKMVEDEVAKYREKLDKNKIQYLIISEEKQKDGSVVIKIIKQYNTSPIGDYLNEDKSHSSLRFWADSKEDHECLVYIVYNIAFAQVV